MLLSKGYEITVFIPGKHLTKDKLYTKDGIRFVEFALIRTKASDFLGYETFIAFEFAAVIGDYLKKENVPDIIESQEYNGIAYYILQMKHLGYPLFSEIKVLLTLHAPSFLYHTYNEVPAYRHPYFWIGEMERWCILAADQLTAPGYFLTQAVQPYFSNKLSREIKVIPYPFEEKETEKDLSKDIRKNLFFFGKLTPQKGIFALLKAINNLRKKGWSNKITIIGGDHYYHPEQTSMRSWIKGKYKEEIRSGKLALSGNLSPSQLKILFNEGVVVIVPSIGDNYPFTVIESMQQGHLVLVSKQGGQGELVKHLENGLVFDHTIEGDLEEKILLINQLSLEALQLIRKKAVTSVSEKHNYETVFKEKKKILDEMIFTTNILNTFPFTRQPKIINNKNENKFIPDLLSVVIPYYNMGDYIHETLESIYKSAYTSFEVIIINDGSSDIHSALLETVSTSYPVQVYSQSNKGLSAARNAGANLAKGEFLVFIDADDKIHPDYFGEAVALLKKKKNVSFVGSWVQYFEQSNGIWPAFTPEPPYLLAYNMVCSGALVYNTNDFLQYGLNDPALKHGLEDWDAVVSMVANGKNGVVIPKLLYYYRIRKGSMARSFTPEKIISAVTYIAKKHHAAYAQFSSDLSALYNANGPAFLTNNITLDQYNYHLLPSWIPFKTKIIKAVKRFPALRNTAFKIQSLLKYRS
ncbi:glycosyltransferase [Lacibacter sediminis]|uniref:Glycosyltransferase n=2 Tax=Lacibacter sediminis TaxID=2760713 RepID=A0A7G5XEE2_9BACT|nr:glycosyltransferase [Lacibacter sediminis]